MSPQAISRTRPAIPSREVCLILRQDYFLGVQGGAGRRLVGAAMSSFIGGAFLNSAQQLVANGKVNAWEAMISGGLSSSFGSIAQLVVPGFYGGMLHNAMRRESTAIYTGIGILMESYVRMIGKASTEMSQ